MAPTFPVEFAGQRVSKKLSSQTNFTRMMGKTRKVSKGHSHGFVPDYRHAVDTMANSEGHLDTEITVSEDSCIPNRKSLNLNPDSHQHFNVPYQVLSLSTLSSLERKELGLRLKHELEQVRTLQKNISMVNTNTNTNTNVGTLSPSDVHSCSAGQRRPVPEFSMSMSLPATHKKAPPGRAGGARSKKTGSTRVESVKRALPPTSGTGNAMLMKQCETLLNRLLGHQFSWLFNAPVDVVALKIPDYYTVIHHPMDLGTVKTKLLSGKYQDPWGFCSDVRLTFSNAMTYNPRGNDVHLMAETLSKYFEVRWKAIEKKLSVIPMRQNVIEPEPEPEIAIPMPPHKKKKTVLNEITEEPVKRTMSVAEKHKLSSELESSIAELPERIIDFLKENSSNATMEDEIEIDIDTLGDDTLFKLRKLLDDFLVENQQKNIAKDEIEVHNESGFSNSSMQPCKVNDGNEEDVDIGGDELPISSFPPVEIERDTAVRNSSSSSSSSGSGSPSSDSDSGSSSGNESVGAKVTTIVNNLNETLGNEVNTEQVTDVPGDAQGGDSECVNGEQKSKSGEVEGRQEGESGPSDRQVSPDKLYRAALLRSRFADTILKAQEKTNGKVEEQDRERLRLEKEEVEKRRKQEKARLEAEAKAAEEARRNAEVEAAAEAKRKRELEREAARQALQKMEKMVDINDNSRFLEDLEMLSVAAPTQPLESLIDETRADCGEELLLGGNSFNLNGKCNPLEQLGLYMKDDEEEEDEGTALQGGDDPEEGEID